LSETELLKLEKDIREFFKNLDGELLGEYLFLVKEWNRITKPKDFPFKQLMYLEEKDFKL
jgi:hypothetical protein